MARDFSADELSEKLNNVSFMDFVYNYVFIISHSKVERRRMTKGVYEGVVGQLSASDKAWAVVKYIDNEEKWLADLARKQFVEHDVVKEVVGGGRFGEEG